MLKNDNVFIYMNKTNENEAWLFNGQNCKRSRIKGLSEDYRPYRHKSRTLSLSHRVGGNQKLNTIDERKSKIDGNSFLLSFVARLAIVNTVSCDFYPHSSIVKSVFDCRLPGIFINTAPALCIARCFVFQIMRTQLQRREL